MRSRCYVFVAIVQLCWANTLFNIVMRIEIEPHGLLGLAIPLLRCTQPMFERNLANIKARLEEPSAAPWDQSEKESTNAEDEGSRI